MPYKILSIKVKTVPTHDGKIKPYVCADVEQEKGVITEEFYPIAHRIDFKNMKSHRVYAIVTDSQENLRLLEKRSKSLVDAFSLTSPIYKTNRANIITTAIPPDCIEQVEKMRINPPKPSTTTSPATTTATPATK
ncbi:MAG: hypothetical protein RLZZ210_1254 [Pseudomonadota bacterium]|jgi:hypothetical protein